MEPETADGDGIVNVMMVGNNWGFAGCRVRLAVVSAHCAGAGNKPGVDAKGLRAHRHVPCRF